MMEITIHIPGLKELAHAVLLSAQGNAATPGALPQTAVQQEAVQPRVSQPQAPQQQPIPQQQAAVQPQPQIPQPQIPQPQTGAVPTAVQTYSTDDLARAAMTLMDSGRQLDLQGLLATFGVESLPALPQAQYGAFATALRGLGAQI